MLGKTPGGLVNPKFWRVENMGSVLGVLAKPDTGLNKNY